MEAKTMLIGDWIIGGTFDGKKIQRVSATNADSISTDIQSLYFDDQFFPVPLTEEILLANGFIATPDTYKQYFLDLGHDDYICVSLVCGEEYVDIKFEYNKPIGDQVFKHCRYVHELQHAMREVGLDEFADNFKTNKDL